MGCRPNGGPSGQAKSHYPISLSQIGTVLCRPGMLPKKHEISLTIIYPSVRIYPLLAITIWLIGSLCYTRAGKASPINQLIQNTFCHDTLMMNKQMVGSTHPARLLRNNRLAFALSYSPIHQRLRRSRSAVFLALARHHRIPSSRTFSS